MTILSEFRRKLWVVRTYNETLNKIPILSIVLMKQIQQNSEWDLVTRRDVDGLMRDIDNLKELYDLIPHDITLKTLITFNTRYISLRKTVMWQTVKSIVEKCGCPMNELLEIYSIKNTDFWSLHSKIFTITDITHVTKTNRQKSYTDLCELAKNENANDYENQPFITRKYPFISSSLVEKTCGAYICYHFDDSFLKISGIYHDDNFDFIKRHPDYKQKNDRITERIKKSKLDVGFATAFYTTLTLRDFMAYSEDELFGKVISGSREHKRLKNKDLTELVLEFNNATRENRVRIICILASGDEKEKLLVTSLFSAMSSVWPATELKTFYHRLPWKVQELVIGSVSMLEEFHRILTISADEIPIEEQIIMMDVNDDIKSKATTKLKEIKSSRENSHKAEQYLRGLLKIPFNKYRKEEIFTFIGSFNEKYRKSLDELIKLIDKHYPAIDNKVLIECYENGATPTFKSLSVIIKKVSDHGFRCINEMLSSVDLSSTYNGYRELIVSWIDLTDKHKEWLEYNKNRRSYLNKTDDILNNCVHGHKDAKEKIQRLVSQWMNGKIEGAVFGFQGPPGVGKTTLAKEGLSKCLTDENGKPRPFCFLPLGGASNGSMLEGHGYTYVGSTWGRIVDMLMSSKCMNPIIYIDELDKISNTEHGREIFGILTHITDPSQNKEFNDRYFSGIDIDLSKVLFIFSYNDSDSIDGILRDRITEINVDQLTIHDKKVIVQKHVIPELTKLIGFENTDIHMTNELTDYIIDTYTYEPGIRKLKEILTDIFRDINMKSIKESHIDLPYEITMDDVDRVMHRKHKILVKKISPIPRVGIINGLYATASGGGGLTIIQVLETASKGDMTLELTGLQGETMKESMSCAKTIASSMLSEIQKLKLKNKDNFGLHIHCPSAGMKKDGPSAGAAITCAILSRICNIPTINTVAMTGEIDLYGNVTAIGGLDCKITGAKRAGVEKILCPKQNEHDYDLFVEHLKDNDEDISKYPCVIFVDTIFDIIPHVFDVDLDTYFCKTWF